MEGRNLTLRSEGEYEEVFAKAVTALAWCLRVREERVPCCFVDFIVHEEYRIIFMCNIYALSSPK